MLEATQRRSSPETSVRHTLVKSHSTLVRINNAKFDLCCWRREPTAALAAWLDGVAQRHTLTFDEKYQSARDVQFERWLSDIPPSPEKHQWLEDLHAVLGASLRVNGEVPLRIQLSTIQIRKCPRFHIDNIGVRLLCTYSGPGTEWIPELSLDRSRLADCTVDDAPLRPGGAVEQLRRFDVALLKGSAFPGNGRFGIVHRSPNVPNAPRIVLTIDTFQQRKH
jgi:hypothetical protein